MNIQSDFEKFLKLLEKNNVRYMIIGGYAVAFHGYPRFTKDMDIFFLNNNENIKKLVNSMIQFGFSKKDINEELFKETGNIIQFGVEPLRIDLLNDIDGISYLEAEKNVVNGHYGDVIVKFIGKDELIKNKSSTNRLKDKADIEELK